jgi:hypothetical protein
LPEAPVTCGIAISGGVNPARAHVGSDDTGGWPAHPFEAALRVDWSALAGAEAGPAGTEATEPEGREAGC